MRQPPRYYEDVVQAVKEFPDRFYGFFGANPKDERVCDMLEMVVEKYGFKGLKFHTYASGVAADDRDWVYPIAEKARELKICMMIHSDPYITGTPWQVGLLALDFPDLPVVMAHMGFMDVACNDAAIKMAKRAPNLYLETCGVSSEASIAKAVREIGADRVLYGSDMPFHDPAFDIARVQYTDISEEEKKMVLGEAPRSCWIPWGSDGVLRMQPKFIATGLKSLPERMHKGGIPDDDRFPLSDWAIPGIAADHNSEKHCGVDG